MSKNNDIDFSFLHEDHFACLSINLSQVMSHKELAEVPWDSIQEQLEAMLGPANSRLEAINRIWVLLDRESMQLMMGGQSSNPLVYVIDYKSFPNLEELEKAQSDLLLSQKENPKPAGENESDEEDSEQEPALVTTAKQIGDSRIVIGSPSLTNKLTGQGTASELQRELAKLDFESDIEGLISIGPIRPTLKTLLSMAAQFGGEEAKELAKVPDALQRVEFEFSLQGDNVMETSVFIDDPEMVEELTRITQQAQQDSGGAMPMGGAMGFPMGGMGGPNGEQESMFPLTAPPIMEKVGKQIQDDNLFSVESETDKLVFQLQRPEAMTELITASIKDANRGFRFGQRAMQLQQIGKGLEAYYREHECFPPAGAVKDSAKGLPDQLNWRVGLLPYIGQDDLYQQFDFNEPWDSEKNLEVAKSIPEMFELESEEKSTNTCFHYPGGSMGLFQKGNGQKSLSDVTDKKSSTAIVVEAEDESAIQWTKPGVLMLGDDFGDIVGKADENGVLFVNGSFDVRMVKGSESKISKQF